MEGLSFGCFYASVTSPVSWQNAAASNKDDVRVRNECASQQFDLAKRERHVDRERERYAPRIIYFDMSRRQIVCPRVRFATENSVGDVRQPLHQTVVRSLARKIKLHPVSVVPSPPFRSLMHPITLRTDAQLSPRVCTPARHRTWVLYVPRRVFRESPKAGFSPM